MKTAPQLQAVSNSAALWHRYDATAKADLWSSAVRTAEGIYLVDPITVQRESLADFSGEAPLLGVIITNANHLRDSLSFNVPVFARFPLCDPDVRAAQLPAELQIIDVPGAPAGEIALISAAGDLIIGDALINFEPYGFTFLPAKYCTDARLMRRSLRQLLSHRFERILFAHGTPITSNAYQRLESLLAAP